MEVASMKGRIPNEILESLQARGISRFTPPQEAAIGAGMLQGGNVVVAAPTASGKTLIAELACINAIIAHRKKAVYIAPMRALVLEKFGEFRAAYPYLRTGVSIGDLDSGDRWLRDYDILFVSTEKFDSLLRHGIEWLSDIGCIVFDEVHMLGDPSRGPTLEVLITKLASMCGAQMVALSATVGNADEIARWLKAKLVVSNWRPVRLKKGVVHEGVAYCSREDGEENDVVQEALGGSSKIQEIRILEDTLSRSKQMLAFYSTKRNAEAGAVKLAETAEAVLTPEEKVRLNALSDTILNALERPTEQCTKLSGLVKRGIAFHHAGLVNAQRSAIEEAFRAGLVKAICSTTTLGLGVNLPAHTVLIRDISRYDSGANEMLGVNEVLQLFGRAGRPKYDKEGRAFIIANYKDRIPELYRTYINARPESVDSNLGVIPVLRTHMLAFIAGNFLNDTAAIERFLLRSFYGFQYNNERHIKNIVDEIVEDLMGFGFIEETGRGSYGATKVGARVSELYIDPLSARWMLNAMERKLDTVSTLYMICNTLEMRPYVRATAEAEEMYSAYRYINSDRSLFSEYERTGYGYYDPARAFSTALMLNDWIDEKREQDIVKKYHTTPGEIFSKLSNADWMIYSAIELAKLTRKPMHDMINVRVRIRYGIREELLDLVRLEQIGRVRARTLYVNGIRTVAELRDSRPAAERLLGKEVAKRVFDQFI